MGRDTMYSTYVRFFLFATLLASSCTDEGKAPLAPPVHPSGGARTTASADLWVYQDALQSPWINASWSATITFNSTDQVYAGSYSIKTAMTAAWGALSLHHGNWGSPGIDPASYQSLDFAVHGGSSGTTLSIFFENDAGQSFPHVNYGTVPPGQWNVVSIPMSQLDPGGQIINRISIQDLSGSARTFYVDNLRLVGNSSGTPPPAPTLAFPANGASGVATSPTLTWNASSGATSYRVQVSTTSAFTSTVVDQGNIAGTSHAVSGLSSSTTYYWRVNATNNAGTSGWSSVWSFTTTGSPPSAPTLVSPGNGSTGIQTNPTFSWNASGGAASYRLQVSTSSGFTSTIVDQGNITGTSHGVSGLSYSTTYYWRVNASNGAGTSAWSAIWSFTTASPPSAAPDLTVDANRLRSRLQTVWRSFSSSSCAVIESCAAPGSRKLLRFDVAVQNFGTADLFFGNPAGNPLFEWSPCHGHYHFRGFAEYRLVTNNGVVVRGRKQAFCLLDAIRYWNGYPSQGYDCGYQGISVGWADLYSRSLDCQWIDITGVTSGDYFLEVEVNVDGIIDEGSNTWPNVARVPVHI